MMLKEELGWFGLNEALHSAWALSKELLSSESILVPPRPSQASSFATIQIDRSLFGR
ncbi:hypothetical protein [Roseococcus sp. DSY-14]